MKLEVEMNPPSIHSNGKATKFSDVVDTAADNVELLNYGIRSAQAGNRAEARTALFRVTESDPRNETAWLWLASISEYPEELLVFLNNVLQINPTNERAREWKVATNSLLAKTFVQRGIDAVESGRKDFAAECFNRALEYDQANEMAWLWMASLSETNEGKLSYLEMVLKVNPDNDAANQAFQKARNEIMISHLAAAKSAAALGQKAEAAELLNAVIDENPDCEDAWMLRSHFADTFAEKITAFEKVLQLNPDNATARFSLDSLRSLIGSIPIAETADPESDESSFGSISGSKLFAYEPEIDRSPTQELEMPAEKLEEFRQFAARNGDASSLDHLPEQPVAEHPEQPVEEFVEQPVPLAEQTEGTDNSADLLEPETVEFELAPSEVAEIAQPLDVISDEFTYNVEPAYQAETDQAETAFPTQLDEIATVADSGNNDYVENVADAAFDTVAQDQTISVSTAENYLFSDVKTNESISEDDLSSVFPQPDGSSGDDEFVALVENAEPVSVFDNGFDTQDVSTDADLEEEIPQPTDIYDFPDSAVVKTDDGILSDQILIAATADADDLTMDDDPFKTVASLSIPMPEYAIPEPKLENNPFATTVEPQYVRKVSESSAPSISNCSFCDAVNESSSISCRYCLAVLTLSDLDMIAGNRHADRTVVKAAVERMENERQHRDLSEAELTVLGIGHLNLQNLQFGYNYLYEASRLNPNNVVLSSQVNALLIRLEDIRKHDETADMKSRGKTILVVDDSPTVRKLIAGKLEKSGHNVFCSADGVEAIEMLADMKPDLILLDINMPRMDGYQTCKSIRSREMTKDIPVVMISGKDGFFDKVRGRMAGTTGYITKPFGPETLMKTVETYLSGNGAELPDNREIDTEL